jgi:hypothetical protein
MEQLRQCVRGGTGNNCRSRAVVPTSRKRETRRKPGRVNMLLGGLPRVGGKEEGLSMRRIARLIGFCLANEHKARTVRRLRCFRRSLLERRVHAIMRYYAMWRPIRLGAELKVNRSESNSMRAEMKNSFKWACRANLSRRSSRERAKEEARRATGGGLAAPKPAPGVGGSSPVKPGQGELTPVKVGPNPVQIQHFPVFPGGYGTTFFGIPSQLPVPETVRSDGSSVLLVNQPDGAKKSPLQAGNHMQIRRRVCESH